MHDSLTLIRARAPLMFGVMLWPIMLLPIIGMAYIIMAYIVMAYVVMATLICARAQMMFVVMFASIGGAVVLMPYLFDEVRP